MRLFQRKKIEKKAEEPVKPVACGRLAIEQEALRIYPGQNHPKHYAALIKWCFGGLDPLDGISVYEGKDYWHFVTYGLTELDEKESENKEISGYGMEFTFKLKKDSYEDEEQEIRCICRILQQIAGITVKNGECFKPYEYLYTGQTTGIDARQLSNITGFITVYDSEFKTLITPNGKVEFIEFIGVTDRELTALRKKELDVKTLTQKLGSSLTDYHRDSVI